VPRGTRNPVKVAEKGLRPAFINWSIKPIAIRAGAIHAIDRAERTYRAVAFGNGQTVALSAISHDFDRPVRRPFDRNQTRPASF
jgi:hypothetical protein